MTCFRHVSWHLQKFVLRISDARTLNGVSLPAPVWAGGLILLGKFEPETLQPRVAFIVRCLDDEMHSTS